MKNFSIKKLISKIKYLKKNSVKMDTQTLEQNLAEHSLLQVQNELNEYRRQFDYLKNHVDITTLKPADGELREYQMDLLDFTITFLKEVEHLGIKPFLMGGNLIGALRHKGFIPWDDDFDLGLMREDYNKLVNFCKKKYKTIIYETKISDYSLDPYAAGTKWDKAISENPNNYVFFIWSDQIQVGKGSSIHNFKFIDFFAFDSYKNDYDFNSHKKYLETVQEEVKNIDYLPAIVDYLESQKITFQNYDKNGDNLYYGIDNMCAYRKKYSKWIPKDYILPLKKMRFENTDFWVPNKTEEYAEYEIPNYLEFPSDLGHSHHIALIKKYINDKCTAIEFYLIDAFEIFHYLPIYRELLARGVNAKIVAEPCEINTSRNWFDYKTAIKILKDLKVPYSTYANKNADIAITTQDVSLLSKYYNKKVSLSYGIGLNRENFSISKSACHGFDACLVHGEYQKEHMKKYIPAEKIYPIGFAKHDDYFKKPLDKTKIKERLNIPSGKPVIAYFPTWDDDTSVQKFGDSIKSLKNKYYIVTKAHHCTFRLEDRKNDLTKIYEISDMVLEGNSSFEEAAVIGDLIIADAKSGATTEIAYLNKITPIIILTPRTNPEEYFMPIIRNFGILINKPQELCDRIKSITNTNIQSDLIEYLYGKNDSQSSARAADAIIGILQERSALKSERCVK